MFVLEYGISLGVVWLSFCLSVLQQERSDLTAERDAALKRISGQEIHIERLRSQLHETLRRAEVEEVALPAVLEETAGDGQGTSQQAGGRGQTRTKRGGRDTEESLSMSLDATSAGMSSSDLRWRGSTTSVRSSSGTGNIISAGSRGTRQGGGISNSSSSAEEGSTESSTGGFHFSESQNPVVLRDSEKVALVDLSSLRAIAGSDRHDVQVSKEKQLAQEIADLLEELESMQPNMHAGERYVGPVCLYMSVYLSVGV